MKKPLIIIVGPTAVGKTNTSIEIAKELNCEIGFSGHGTGIAGASGATALDAKVVEKHVTLNKKNWLI